MEKLCNHSEGGATVARSSMPALKSLPGVRENELEMTSYQLCSLQPGHDLLQTALYQLSQQLPPLWITVREEDGINVLLLSRTKERSVQRRAFFSFTGEEEIFIHHHQLSGPIMENILQPRESYSIDILSMQGIQTFVFRIVSLIKRLQGYEVCVGVPESEYKQLWDVDKSGNIDTNPFRELRYVETFRPFACHRLVSTMNNMKRRCLVCKQAKIKFRVKLKRHLKEDVNPRTANVYLDRNQLLNKITLQQKQLKNSRAQVVKLKTDLQSSLLHSGLSNCLSEEIFDLCMNYTAAKNN